MAEAHLSMGAIYLWGYDWKRADTELARALELSPRLAEAHRVRCEALVAANRMDEALEEQRKATESDPIARPFSMALMLIRRHEYDAAIDDARIRVRGMPNEASVHYLLSRAYLWKGIQPQSAQEMIQAISLSGDKRLAAQMRATFARAGHNGLVQVQLEDLKRQAKKSYRDPIWFAYLYAELGQPEETLRYLQEAYKVRSPWLVFLQHEPEFDFLHADMRYRAIVQNVGLPPAF